MKLVNNLNITEEVSLLLSCSILLMYNDIAATPPILATARLINQSSVD